jgi:hypothetical protein
MSATTVVLFTRDLRVHDQPVLRTLAQTIVVGATRGESDRRSRRSRRAARA